MKNAAEFHWTKAIFLMVVAWSRNYQITRIWWGVFNVLYQPNQRMRCTQAFKLLCLEKK